MRSKEEFTGVAGLKAVVVDHRNKLNPVKDQGSCGSCWAFSAQGTIEGTNSILLGSLNSFSEQYLNDCDKKSSGCNGGLMKYAFDLLIANANVLEHNYPYAAKNQVCQNPARTNFWVTSRVAVAKTHTAMK
jgi:C1A family cysteine protease